MAGKPFIKIEIIKKAKSPVVPVAYLDFAGNTSNGKVEIQKNVLNANPYKGEGELIATDNLSFDRIEDEIKAFLIEYDNQSGAK